jgi:TolB-like protein
MKLFSELKRRNVLRMAAFYLAAAWLLMQVVDVLEGPLPLPDWIGGAVLAVLAVGFPIALIVSWFWDITPEGVVRDADLPEGQPSIAASGRRTDFVIIAMLAAAVLLLLVWDPPTSGDDAITVLPFESMSGPDEAPFSEGVSIELQTLLAQLRKFKVKLPPEKDILSRFSDVPTLAREMNVRWVLKGSVRRAESRVRISAQLIDADDDSAIAWSNVFDRDLSAANLFAIQTEIARKIASELRIVFDESAEQRLAAPPTQNTEAYSAYLLGRQRLTDGTVAAVADAVEQFALAIELDPQFANAYSGLADACFTYRGVSGAQSNEHCPSSSAGREQLARKALELDPESGEAWISLGHEMRLQAIPTPERVRNEGWPKIREELQEAVAAVEHGLELDPTLSHGYAWLADNLIWYHVYPDPPFGWIKAWQSGRWETVLDRGLEVDPLSLGLHRRKVWYPVRVGSKDEAMWHARRIIEIAPDSPRGYEVVGGLEWDLNGRVDESVHWWSKTMAIDPQDPTFPGDISDAYAMLGDPDMALAYLDLAKALSAPGNPSILEDQIRIQLVAGRVDARQVADMLASLSESQSTNDFMPSLGLRVFVDLALGRPEDALARIETFSPRGPGWRGGDYEVAHQCLDASEIPEELPHCPDALVRVYQELGDHEAAQALSDAIVRRGQSMVDSIPNYDVWNWGFAGSLATAGRTDEALDMLENLVASGWRREGRFWLCCNVAYDAIRDHSRFRAIAATIEADMAQQLENVRDMQRRGEVPTLEEVRALIASIQENG